MSNSVSTNTPVGRLTIAAADDAIVAIRWADDGAGTATPLLAEALRQLEAYFAGKLIRFDLPLAPRGSIHELRVWEAMRRIPHGQTRSYGDLALEIGSAPRAVGRACGRNPIPIVIPCHRVLGRTVLGGYSGGAGLATKRALLALEAAALPVPSSRAAKLPPGSPRQTSRAPMV
jgi:methylated-DNA-[protein]-cysteine S-methyltransferase